MLGRLVSKGLFFFCCSFSVQAAELSLQERLNAFQTLTAHFTQVVHSEASQEEQSGVVQIKRPHHFSWEVKRPYEQSIVSNGQKIWQYEPDLNQVIVRQVDRDLQGVPLLLLSGETQDLEKIFQVQAKGRGVFELVPLALDQVVKKIILEFQSDHLSRLAIENNLGQKIEISFSEVSFNPPLADSVFEFKIPAQAEVLEQ